MNTINYIEYDAAPLKWSAGVLEGVGESGLRVMKEEELHNVTGAVAPLVVAAWAAGAFVVAAVAGYWANRC